MILFALIVGSTWQPALAQDRGKYFWQTGHNLLGEFWDAWSRVSNPERLYGYPITDAFFDKTINTTVQYFQKTRFEIDPTAPYGQRVKQSPVGEYSYVPGDAVVEQNSSGCRLFPPQGFQICYAFLEFFDAYGGIAQFGKPISNFEYQNSRLVQNFQYARFEWHPDRPVGERVVLTDLGTHYFHLHQEKAYLLRPQPIDEAIIDNNAQGQSSQILELKVRAFPKFAVTALNGQQAIYVMVQDQLGAPVANAHVTIDLNPSISVPPSGNLPPTDDRGYTFQEFSFNATSLGLVEVIVTVSINELEGSTLTSFRVWW